MSNASISCTLSLTKKVWQTGEVILLLENIHHNKMNSVGIVYQVLTHEGEACVGILLETGYDIGLVETANIHNSFLPIGRVELTYTFSSPDELMQDYIKGRFTPAFDRAKHYADSTATS